MEDTKLKSMFTTGVDLGDRVGFTLSDAAQTWCSWELSPVEQAVTCRDARSEGKSFRSKMAHTSEADATVATQSNAPNPLSLSFNQVLSLQDIVHGRIDGIEAVEISGGASGDRFGRVVTGGIDFNNDGIDDLMVGADEARIPGLGRAGTVYIFFGGQQFNGSLAADTLADFRINGVQQNGRLGFDLDGATDINGDGFDDLIIGARLARPNDRRKEGEVYVVFGSEAQDSSLDLNRLDMHGGFTLNGTGQGSKYGKAVSGLGDINGDGVADFAAGAFLADNQGDKNAGKTFILFGGQDFEGSGKLRDFEGFVFRGGTEGDGSGRSVDGIGDINGDGITDMVIGAPNADGEGGRNSGEAYIIFGSEKFSKTLEPQLLDGSNGLRVSGEGVDDRFGYHVAGVGDVNNDGVEDFAIGARQADPLGRQDAGITYIVYGGQPFDAGRELNDLDGFRVFGASAGDQSGFSLSSAGDFNGDGIDDLLIGARFADVEGLVDAGEAYVIFGGEDLPEVIDLAFDARFVSQGEITFIHFQGYLSGQQVGASVSSAGDHNNDGFDDIIFGGPEAEAGSIYIMYGNDGFLF